jgi:hypothetical protein
LAGFLSESGSVARFLLDQSIMLNVSSPQSGYFQSTCFGNLPRLLDSFNQAGIHCTVLTGTHTNPAIASPEMVELLLDAAGYAKFQQVFLDQRCVRLVEYGDHTFWDSRTGLTMHLLVSSEVSIRSTAAERSRSRHHHAYQMD